MPALLLVAETYGEEDARRDETFSGGTGYVVKSILAQCGIEPQSYSSVTYFPIRGSEAQLFTQDQSQASQLVGIYSRKPRLFLDKRHDTHVLRFRQIVERENPVVILCFGELGMWLLTGKRGIAKNRGAPMLALNRKLIATYSPMAIIRNWPLRPIVVQDVRKAFEESKDPRLTRPKRILHLNPQLEDIESFYNEYIVPAPILSIDVETKQGQITEVGIATSRSRALVIPFWSRAAKDGNYWSSLAAEREAWAWVRKIMLTKRYIGQNFQYDMQYFYRTMGIPCPGFAGDTMLLHHALQPEMEKGLGFLGSIYTREPAWKFLRTDSETLKKED